MNTQTSLLQRFCTPIALLARQAGAAIMEIYAEDFAVSAKADESPVTAADQKAEAIILQGLHALTPGFPIVAEEEVAAGRVPEIGQTFWLVDPLDGTKEFITRNGEFTVNIALIEKNQPILGCVFAPAINRLFLGGKALGAWLEDTQGRRQIEARKPPATGLTVVASRSHNDPAMLAQFLDGKQIERVLNAGSSLKLCLLAAGEADLYPRLGRTMEWDIAAGHAVLLAAGGCIQTLAGEPLGYGKAGFANPHFVARGLAG